MLSDCTARPFERMQFLRGTENLFLDLAYQPRELFQLRDQVHDYYLRDLRQWCATDVDGVMFMDDWGTQHALLISRQRDDRLALVATVGEEEAVLERIVVIAEVF